MDSKHFVDTPDLPLEDFSIPDQELDTKFRIKNAYEGSVEYGVIGSGQAGGRIAKSFYDIGYKKAIALNTATADLNPLDLPNKQKLLIGDAQGSGKSMRKGQEAVKNGAQKIFDLMRDVYGTVDKIIIAVGFGGGTGAGSLPTLIEIAQKYLDAIGVEDPVKNVIVLAALPTAGELKSNLVAANVITIKDVVRQLISKDKVGPVLYLDNSRIEKLYRGIPTKTFWSTINQSITGLFQVFNMLSSQESEYTSFDAEDYKKVLSASGFAVMGVALANKDSKLSQVLQDNVKKTLLAEDVDFGSAKEVACVLVSEDSILGKVSMDDLNYSLDNIHNLLGDANLHRGIYVGKKKGIRAYTFITGMKGKSKNESL